VKQKIITRHTIRHSDARQMSTLSDQSVDLVVTSPPYPMIKMWDHSFIEQNPLIERFLYDQDGQAAFSAMHSLLDDIWRECYRTLKPGGFACINIGDAVRTLDGRFSLYPNHARILNIAQSLGFSVLPCILWRKQTNAPNKFMGSGMLPAGAYITLEHEYILVLRKQKKREFNTHAQKRNRQTSAIFWEERNRWFSDLWLDIKGCSQTFSASASRKRSAAFPFELACRLINMYSVKGDLVADPFWGSGTTSLAAIACERHSAGYEIDPDLPSILFSEKNHCIKTAKKYVHQRLARHIEFIEKCRTSKKPLGHTNVHYGFPVMTRQETHLLLNTPESIIAIENSCFQVEYAAGPQPEFCKN
jgi:DNA modification methylase